MEVNSWYKREFAPQHPKNFIFKYLGEVEGQIICKGIKGNLWLDWPHEVDKEISPSEEKLYVFYMEGEEEIYTLQSIEEVVKNLAGKTNFQFSMESTIKYSWLPKTRNVTNFQAEFFNPFTEQWEKRKK